jgi:uncharacterized protein
VDRERLAPSIRPHDAGATLQIRVVPRAPRTEVVGRYGEAVKLKVAAPPADGAANDVVRDFLAKLVGVRAGEVELLARERSRDKVVLVHGCRPEALLDALAR